MHAAVIGPQGGVVGEERMNGLSRSRVEVEQAQVDFGCNQDAPFIDQRRRGGQDTEIKRPSLTPAEGPFVKPPLKDVEPDEAAPVRMGDRPLAELVTTREPHIGVELP